MDSHGIANDKVTSLYVPFAYSVDLYKDDNFSGDMLTITGAIFEDTNFTMKCVELDSDWNDELSSLRVYKNRQIGEAQGFWSQITNQSSSAFEFTVSIGLEYERISTTDLTEKESLAYEMSLGFAFEASQASYDISSSYTNQIMSDTLNYFDLDTAQTFTI